MTQFKWREPEDYFSMNMEKGHDDMTVIKTLFIFFFRKVVKKDIIHKQG